MKPLQIHLACLVVLALSACAAFQGTPTQIIPPTQTAIPPSETPLPTHTPSPTPTTTPTETIPPPTLTPTITLTPTPTPQQLLLRRVCGRDFVVRANQPIEIFYGGWGVLGLDLAREWVTSLTVLLTIGGNRVEGSQQPPAPELPLNCRPDTGDTYWIYYKAVIPGLAPGFYNVTMAFKASKALPDGSGVIYGPGQIAKQTFRITSQ